MKFKFKKNNFSENIMLYALTILIVIFSVISIKSTFFVQTKNNIKVIKKTVVIKNNSLKSYTTSGVAKHNTKGDCFIIINKNVYNATSIMPFINTLKNTAVKITNNPCGEDNTEIFNLILKQYPLYNKEIKNSLKNYLIGKIN